MVNRVKQAAMVIAIVLAVLVASAFSKVARQNDEHLRTWPVEKLPAWKPPSAVQGTPFELGAGKSQFRAWGRDKEYRVFFPEFLPALFERTLVLERLDPNCALNWIFTGKRGGFTVTVDHKKVGIYQRFYDSSAFDKIAEGRRLRHPEQRGPTTETPYAGSLRAVTVGMNHKLGLSVALNGRMVLRQECLLDISRHQLRLTGTGQAHGKMLKPEPQTAVVHVEPEKRHQTMIGFGGIATPTAYAQLSPEGKRRWWQLVCEYNLLVQREYPIGRRLDPEIDNWDRLEDATPHYYGDNFPNGEVSDFTYIKTLRRLGGKVWFEFWALPPWVGDNPEKYAEATVRYCQVSKEKTGVPPDVVGIQNEKRQSESMWHRMTLALRRQLDQAGFQSVRIHMSDAGRLSGGIERATAFRSSRQVWAAIDYSATHMYDYQQFFTDPDAFDPRLLQWKQLTADKPFLSTELCINSDKYQWPTYRVAMTMAQLYHKNLVLADASAICYCWLLLNVEQPSYGWTRTLFVPGRSQGFVPVPSSYQLRTFGAYSRRIREGMVRVEARIDANDLLVSAFAGEDSTTTVIVLNRSTRPRQLRLIWPGVAFTEMELVDPYHENFVQKAPGPSAHGQIETTIEPGAIVTLTSVPLGRLADDVLKEIETKGVRMQ